MLSGERERGAGEISEREIMRLFTLDERGFHDAAAKSVAAPDCLIAGHRSTRVTPCRNLAHKSLWPYDRQQMRNL